MNKGAREIDIAATLEHLRDQRLGVVATRQQFEFVLMAVAEEVCKSKCWMCVMFHWSILLNAFSVCRCMQFLRRCHKIHKVKSVNWTKKPSRNKMTNMYKNHRVHQKHHHPKSKRKSEQWIKWKNLYLKMNPSKTKMNDFWMLLKKRGRERVH